MEGRFVGKDVLYTWTFCRRDVVVDADVLEAGCFVAGRFVAGCFVGVPYCTVQRFPVCQIFINDKTLGWDMIIKIYHIKL
jgi:hypothetical protein